MSAIALKITADARDAVAGLLEVHHATMALLSAQARLTLVRANALTEFASSPQAYIDATGALAVDLDSALHRLDVLIAEDEYGLSGWHQALSITAGYVTDSARALTEAVRAVCGDEAAAYVDGSEQVAP
jgi:hypothetical protein